MTDTHTSMHYHVRGHYKYQSGVRYLKNAFCKVKHSASQQHMQVAGQNDHRKVNDKLTC